VIPRQISSTRIEFTFLAIQLVTDEPQVFKKTLVIVIVITEWIRVGVA